MWKSLASGAHVEESVRLSFMTSENPAMQHTGEPVTLSQPIPALCLRFRPPITKLTAFDANTLEA